MSRSLVLLFLCVATLTASAQTVPPAFIREDVVTGLSSPFDFCFLPDGRVLVAEGAGAIRVRTNGATSSLVGTVANVQFGGERGLLSITPDPDFINNGYIYTWSARTTTNNMVLARHTLGGDLADPASTNLTLGAEHILVNNAPDNAFNHNGGSCRFGPDDMLYVTIGDDANACSAQNQNSNTGVMLRMDVSNVPAGASASSPSIATLDPGDNPNSGSGSSNALVIAFGLRNPWGMEIDQLTGNLYIGDVGAGAREECSEYIAPTAGNFPSINFGWPWREGLIAGFGCGGTQPTGLVNPIVDISHAQGWVSVRGGPRYRQQGGPFDFPANYEGDYFYADFFAGEIRRLENVGGNWQPAAQEPGQPSATDWGTGFNNITSLRQGPDGAIYYTRRSPGVLGRIRSMGPVDSVNVVSGANQYAPSGEAFADPIVVEVTDPMGSPLAGVNVNFSISGAGVLSSTVEVTDAMGRAQVDVTTTNVAGGATITVNASTLGGNPAGTAIPLNRRDLRITYTTTPPNNDFLIVSVTNNTQASPANVPYLLMLGDPTQTPLQTFIGQICLSPFSAQTLIFEDPFGFFGGVQTAPNGSTGTPNLTRVYSLANNALVGFSLSFLAIGFDSAENQFFRTDCETLTF